MTDAPEQIWAMTPDIGEYWAEPPVNVEDRRFLTEYIRADLATRQRDDAVAAAYEAAVEIAGMRYNGDMSAAYDKRQSGKDDNHYCGGASAAQWIESEIRALKKPTGDKADD